MVNHLYNEMLSHSLGTYLNDWKIGMLKHVRHDVTASAWSAQQYVGTGNSGKFINAINSSDPVAIRFDLFDGGGKDITWHYVTGIGYDKNGSYEGDLHVAYLDPDNGNDNNGRHWIDWSSEDQDIDFIYME